MSGSDVSEFGEPGEIVVAPVTASPVLTNPMPRPRRRRRNTDRGFSRAFRIIATTAAILLLCLLAAVAIFLVARALPAFTASEEQMAQFGHLPQGMTNIWQLIGPLIFGTLIAAFFALLIATPIAVGIALFISHYAPKRLAAP
ncbi:MAG: hypothetical protein FWG25_11495, partial [Promicromonosporaceae bacterium]|nr:hypothetical protein [Promicromonosporaceae bacterium]